MRCLLLLSTALALTAGQDAPSGGTCGPSFTKAFACVLPKAMTIRDKMPAKLSKEQQQQAEESMQKCFTELVANGCVLPSEELGELEGLPDPLLKLVEMANKLGVVGLDVEKLKVSMKAGVACGKKLKKTMKPVLEECVRSQNPLLADFKLPDLSQVMQLVGAEDDFDMELLPTIGAILKKAQAELEAKMESLANVVVGTYHPEVCPDGLDQSRKVRDCVLALVDEYTPEELKCKTPMHVAYMLLDAKVDMCNTVDQCVEDNMSAECKALKAQELVGYLCTCVEQVVDDNWTMMRDEMMSCMQEETGEMLDVPSYFTAKKGPVYSFTMKTVRKMCAAAEDERNDICNDNEWFPLDFSGGEGQGQGGGNRESGSGGGGKSGNNGKQLGRNKSGEGGPPRPPFASGPQGGQGGPPDFAGGPPDFNGPPPSGLPDLFFGDN